MMIIIIIIIIIIAVVIIIAIMIMMIKIILTMAVGIIINIPFQPGDFSTGSTTGGLCEGYKNKTCNDDCQQLLCCSSHIKSIMHNINVSLNWNYT